MTAIDTRASAEQPQVDELERRVRLLESGEEMPPALTSGDWMWVLLGCAIIPAILLVVAWFI